VALITLDDYYLPGTEAKKFFPNESIDWDNPVTINWEKLHNDLDKLLNGESIEIKKFNYDTNSHTDTVVIEPAKVIILEGIFSLQNEKLNELSNLKLYVHADADTRLIRRIKRDKALRYDHFDEHKFMDLWINQIKPSHDKYIAPSQKIADFVINTTNHMESAITDSIEFLIELGINK
jgi:uridine kinase